MNHIHSEQEEEEDEQWEEVPVPDDPQSTTPPSTAHTPHQDQPTKIDATRSPTASDDDDDSPLEITISRQKTKKRVPRLTKTEKETLVRVHQAHILCWLVHGQLWNRVGDDATVQALLVSMVPEAMVVRSVQAGSSRSLRGVFVQRLEQLVGWWMDLYAVDFGISVC
jgi:hypothetical protein